MSQNITNFFIFRDTRLKGELPFTASWLITSQLDPGTPLTNAFARLKMAVNMHGKLKTLFILCHGDGQGVSTKSDFWWQGGTGLSLGKEGVTERNVSAWAAIKDCVENIVVYACGAAYSGPAVWGGSPERHNGKALMKSLSTYTNAVVFAADRIQWYYPSDFNFGKWEGTVYAFYPFGGIIPDIKPPTEVIDVISPIESSIGTSYDAYRTAKLLREIRLSR